MKQSILKKPSTFRENFDNGEEIGQPSHRKLDSESTKLLFENNDKNLVNDIENNHNNTAPTNSSTTPSSKNVRFFGVDLVKWKNFWLKNILYIKRIKSTLDNPTNWKPEK